MKVVAPHDGLLVMERGWRGETISIGESLSGRARRCGEIPDLGALEAKVYVLEAPTQEASRPDALPASRSRESRARSTRRQGLARRRRGEERRDWRSPTKYFETDPELREDRTPT